MSESILDIQGLCISTLGGRKSPPLEILKNIDLTLKRGEVLGLIGESGAGKSTLGLAALGYAKRGLSHTAGRIVLDGETLRLDDPVQLRRLRGRKVAYVAQSAAAAFNPAHKLLTQVIEVARIHGQGSARKAAASAIELFERMGLPDPSRFGERYPHEVSGGQLQRAMTAMALVGRPQLVVFDEPTTALDVTTQIDVLMIIKEVIEELGTAALYVSHDLAVVAQMADRIKVLRNGAEIEEQRTDALLSRPQQAYTRQLLEVRHREARPSAGEGKPLIDINRVSADYGRLRVLRDIDIVLHAGANLALVGESGSGKSTLARVITGLLPPSSGQVSFHGKPLSKGLERRSRAERKAIQMIYQLPDVALNPRHTVLDTIARPAFVFGDMSWTQAKSRAQELLDMVELGSQLADSFPGQLSGGQKQRVCIARALAAEPELVICDEVTSALDPLVARGILDLLLSMQRKLGIAYLFITHDIGMVRAIADDIVVMRGGRIVEQGPRREIFAPPYADYTQLLIMSTPEMREGWLEQAIVERRMEAAGN